MLYLSVGRVPCREYYGFEGRLTLISSGRTAQSDADTSKIKVKLAPTRSPLRPTVRPSKRRELISARLPGASRKEVIDKQGRITVRLQGIDAPELHYRAAALKKSSNVSDAKRAKFNSENKPDRRQYWAETATVAVAKKLSTYGAPVKCEVISLIDKPFEVVDTYGRFVANITSGAGFKTDINLWLAEQGWAYPTFYSSMTQDEIEAYLKILSKAKNKGRIWKDYSTDTGKFDSKLVLPQSTDQKSRKGQRSGADAENLPAAGIIPCFKRRQALSAVVLPTI